jgi:hypothetical protein
VLRIVLMHRCPSVALQKVSTPCGLSAITTERRGRSPCCATGRRPAAVGGVEIPAGEGCTWRRAAVAQRQDLYIGDRAGAATGAHGEGMGVVMTIPISVRLCRSSSVDALGHARLMTVRSDFLGDLA